MGLLVASCQTAGIKRVYTSTDGAGNYRRTTFYTDSQSIFCVAELASGRDDLTVRTTIRLKRRYDPFTRSLSEKGAEEIGVEEIAPGKGENLRSVVSVTKKGADGAETKDAAPFIVGEYECAVSIEGDAPEIVHFEVRFPEDGCPSFPARDGHVCSGYYPPGAVCPGTSTRGTAAECTCTDGAWSCL